MDPLQCQSQKIVVTVEQAKNDEIEILKQINQIFQQYPNARPVSVLQLALHHELGTESFCQKMQSGFLG